MYIARLAVVAQSGLVVEVCNGNRNSRFQFFYESYENGNGLVVVF